MLNLTSFLQTAHNHALSGCTSSRLARLMARSVSLIFFFRFMPRFLHFGLLVSSLHLLIFPFLVQPCLSQLHRHA